MQLAFPGRSALTEATWLVGNISTIYVPQLVTGITTGEWDLDVSVSLGRSPVRVAGFRF